MNGKKKKEKKQKQKQKQKRQSKPSREPFHTSLEHHEPKKLHGALMKKVRGPDLTRQKIEREKRRRNP
jgi:hypothetical protein